MARAVQLDPFHCFRFAPQVDFHGKGLGVSRIDILPGKPWQGRGEVHIQSAWKPEIVEFAKISDPFPLVIGVYHITDEMGSDAPPPSGQIVLTNVNPAQSSMQIDPLDASSSDVFQVKLKMDYDRLTFVFGDNLLEKIAAVV